MAETTRAVLIALCLPEMLVTFVPLTPLQQGDPDHQAEAAC